MSSTSSDRHWLVEVASHVNLELDLPSEPSPEVLARAWKAVAEACNVDDRQLTRRVSQHFRLGLADLSTWDPQAVALLPERAARTLGILPLSLEENRIAVATADPANATARREIRDHAGRHPLFLVASPRAIAEAMDRAYAPDQSTRSTLQTLIDAAASDDLRIVTGQTTEELVPLELEAPAVVKLAGQILRVATRYRATEIHLEPGRENGCVRYRIDGVLQRYVDLPMKAQARLVARFKNMATETSATGEGPPNTFPVKGRNQEELEVQLRNTPTPDGEHVTLRIIDPHHEPGLGELGFDDATRERVGSLLSSGDGLILVTGPARSGKTTLVYATLSSLSGVNAVSLENPVERILEGVTQIQYDASEGRSYATVLQELLGKTPDVIHAGEIRDRDTARTALRAAVTGRRVIATLHTGDALSGINRLVEMGLDPSRLVESLRGVISLRLLRRLCPSCAEPVNEPKQLSSRELKLARIVGALPRRRAVGCPRCGRTGYRGQLPLAEVLHVTPRLASKVAEDAPRRDLEAEAKAGGMRTFWEAARERIAAGETSFQEAERVLGLIPDVTQSAEAMGPVLVVDDEEQDRFLIRGVLEDMAFQVVEAEGGREALSLLKSGEHDFSLVVLDLIMPEVDGTEVLRRIRRSLSTQALPVVVLTASPDPRHEIELLDAGADDYILKPIVVERLQARVSAVLRRSGFRLSQTATA